jgi:diguanylate cyclase (GGDEF)-like protein
VALRTRELSRVNDLLQRTHEEWQRDEREIRRLNARLERGIAERNEELARAHEELQTAFRHKSMLLSEIQQYSQTMEQQAMEDSLTRLSNRRYFDLHFAREVSRALRFGRELTLALADIDGFKGINDNFSHAIGDKVLISVGSILQRMSRQSDLVARWGGDEFVIVMPETTLSRGAVLCERIRRIVERFPWHNIHPGLKITLSVGLSGGDAAAGAEALAARADAKLYEAKNQGRNRVRH